MRRSMLSSVAISTALCSLASASGPWEWGGVFTLEANKPYWWSAERNSDGDYADPRMKMVVVRAPSADPDGLEAAETDAETLWNTNSWTTFTDGGVLDLEGGVAATLDFDDDMWVNFFRVRVRTTGAYAFFCEHMPFEFEKEFHFFRDDKGEDVEPAAAEENHAGHGGHGDEDGGQSELDDEGSSTLWFALGATFLSTLPSMLMILVLGATLSRIGEKFMPFASGAITALSIFLLLPEGIEFTKTWAWGTAILVGWLFCAVVHHVTDLIAPREEEATSDVVQVAEAPAQEAPAADAPPESADAEKQADTSGAAAVKPAEDKPQKINWSLCLPILVGDFLHNVVDGIVLGFSAKYCSSAATWGIVLATILHEAPQELADFAILVGRGNMKWSWAVASNFAVAQTATLGALWGHEVNVNEDLQGIILAFSGGVFLFIGLSELGPSTIHLKERNIKESVLVLFMFILGATLIGLVLINHEHCTPVVEGVADPHAGHDHR